jgi:hypothetical protein
MNVKGITRGRGVDFIAVRSIVFVASTILTRKNGPGQARRAFGPPAGDGGYGRSEVPGR